MADSFHSRAYAALAERWQALADNVRETPESRAYAAQKAEECRTLAGKTQQEYAK